MTGDQFTAGTAGAGYRSTPAAHVYDPRPAEWGERPVCRRCRLARSEHSARAAS